MMRIEGKYGDWKIAGLLSVEQSDKIRAFVKQQLISQITLRLTAEMTEAESLKSTFLLLAEAGLLAERGLLTREESDEVVRVFIKKIVSHVKSPYCDIDNESGETYYLFRISHSNEPFAVIDEQNKTYYTFRPVPQS